MKKHLGSLLFLGLMLIPQWGWAADAALVRRVGGCTTVDGHFDIRVLDNQGTSTNRSPHLVATNTSHTRHFIVEAFDVEQAESGGFIDTETNGARFYLADGRISFDFSHAQIHLDPVRSVACN